MAVGQPTFATSLKGGDTPRDGNYAWEWWYEVQVTDHIAVTPALFYLSRPLGGDTPEGRSFNQLGDLSKPASGSDVQCRCAAGCSAQGIHRSPIACTPSQPRARAFSSATCLLG